MFWNLTKEAQQEARDRMDKLAEGDTVLIGDYRGYRLRPGFCQGTVIKRTKRYADVRYQITEDGKVREVRFGLYARMSGNELRAKGYSEVNYGLSWTLQMMPLFPAVQEKLDEIAAFGKAMADNQALKLKVKELLVSLEKQVVMGRLDNEELTSLAGTVETLLQQVTAKNEAIRNG